MQCWIWWVMQVNTSQCFIPTVSNKHKLLRTYSEENTWRFLFTRDFCMWEDLLPGTWTKYWGSVKYRSAATGGQMGGLSFLEWIIYFLSSTIPFLSNQTDVLFSSNTLFSLLPIQNGEGKSHSRGTLLWVWHSCSVVGGEGSYQLGQADLVRKIQFRQTECQHSLIVRVRSEYGQTSTTAAFQVMYWIHFAKLFGFPAIKAKKQTSREKKFLKKGGSA